jgi:hypothetical protein
VCGFGADLETDQDVAAGAGGGGRNRQAGFGGVVAALVGFES